MAVGRGLRAIALCWVCACSGGPTTVREDGDTDGDGVLAPEDCDDHDALAHPGAEERCDGVDNDCDGVVEDYVVRFGDRDGDGWGDPADERILCDAVPAELADDNLDCDDDDPLVHPNAVEPPCEGVDLNCDGVAVPEGWVFAAGEVWPSLRTALSETDDEVLVCPGTHVGPFLVESAVIRSVGGAERTILRAEGGPVLLVVEDGSLVLDGVTVTGGDGGGLLVGRGASATVRSSRISGNYAGLGGGVLADQGAVLTLDRTVISGNVASMGGGVCLTGATAYLLDSTVEDNDAYYGGGVQAWDASLQLERSTVLGNSASEGGGLSVSETEVTLDGGSRVADNGADFGGGVSLYDATLSGGTVEGNLAVYGGGVFVYLPSDAAELTDVVVRGNDAEVGGGLDVHAYAYGYYYDSYYQVSYDGSIELPGSELDGNTAAEGSAVALEGAVLHLDAGARVTGNVASELSGAVLLTGWGRVVSEGAWWGLDGVDANLLTDVHSVGGASRDVEGFATFDCTYGVLPLDCSP